MITSVNGGRGREVVAFFFLHTHYSCVALAWAMTSRGQSVTRIAMRLCTTSSDQVDLN